MDSLLQHVLESVVKNYCPASNVEYAEVEPMDLESLFKIARQNLQKHTTSTTSNLASNFACDVREMETYVMVYMDLPGVDKSTISLSIDDTDVLTIKVNRKLYGASSDIYHMRERFEGLIDRKVKLPLSNLDKAQIKASYEDGVLKVRINKLTNTSTSVTIPVL